MADEEVLEGGNSTEAVVRVGRTVRKPWVPSTPHVAAYMTALADAGVDVPRHLGRDDVGRQIVEFVPGQLAITEAPLTSAGLARVGGMVRAIHDASANHRPSASAVWDSAIAAPGDHIVCHNDLAPWNLVLGERWVFIDWDAAAPSTRLWDLAYAAQAFSLSDPSERPDFAAARLRAFVDGYGADREMRDRLPDTLIQRVDAMYALLADSHRAGAEPWASMFTSGHGDHWRATAGFVRRGRNVWAAALHESG